MNLIVSQAEIFPRDTIKFAGLFESSVKLRRSNPDSAFQLAIEALQIAKEIDSPLVAQSYRNLGIIHKNRSEYDQAVSYYRRALALFKGEKLEADQAIIYNDLGNVHKYMGEYTASFEFYIKSTALREKLDLKPALAGSYMNIGNFLNQQGNFVRAQEYYRKSISMCRETTDSLRLGRALMNSGINETSLRNHDEAEKLLTESLQVSLFTDRKRLPLLNTNFGNLYQQKANYRQALNKFNLATDQYTSASDLYGKYNSIANAGWAHLSLKDYAAALQNARLALVWAEEFEVKELQVKCLRLVADVLQKQGKFKESAETFRRYHYLHDTLYNSEKTEIIEDLRVRYETEKKEKELAITDAQLAKSNSELQVSVERNQNLLITLIVALSLTLVIIFLYQQRQRVVRQLRKKDKSIFDQRIDDLLQEQEIKSLSASLETQERERKRIAEDLHDRLGSMLSSVKLHYDSATSSNENQKKFKKAADILDETIRETRKIAYNLNSGVLAKFGLVPALEDLKGTIESTKKIEVELNVHNIDERLTNDLEVNIYRVIQEAVSNALKHSSASQITIQLTRHDDDHLTLMIADDGTGFDSKEKSMGMGLQNMEARMSKFEGEVTIDSRKDHGTTITVDIPNPQFLEQ